MAVKANLRDLGAVVALAKSTTTLRGLYITNAQGATAFVQLFDAVTGSVTLGTTVPDAEFQIAANTSLVIPLPNDGIRFANAISAASTTGEKGATPSAAGVQLFALV